MNRSGWIDALAVVSECIRRVRVAEQISYSSAIIKQVLKGIYTLNLEKVRTSVEAR